MKDYIPAEKFTDAKIHYGHGGKFERPQLLQINNRPAYIYFPAGTNIKGTSATIVYVLKVD